jgi:hypothetical protein
MGVGQQALLNETPSLGAKFGCQFWVRTRSDKAAVWAPRVIPHKGGWRTASPRPGRELGAFADLSWRISSSATCGVGSLSSGRAALSLSFYVSFVISTALLFSHHAENRYTRRRSKGRRRLTENPTWRWISFFGEWICTLEPLHKSALRHLGR